MKNTFTISTQAIVRTFTQCSRVTRLKLYTMLAAMLIVVGFSPDASAQCSNLTVQNSNPSWNGQEYCSSYNPSNISAPAFNYTGTCAITPPRYYFTWEESVDGGAWTSVSEVNTGNGVFFVPGYDPPTVTAGVAGSPLKVYQWRLRVTDVSNGNQTANSATFTVSLASQLVVSCPSDMTVPSGMTQINLDAALDNYKNSFSFTLI